MLDELNDRTAIRGSAVDRIDAVDAKPAVFVERHSNRVDVPFLHCADRAHGVFGLSAREAPPWMVGFSALAARELRPRDVNPMEKHRGSSRIDELRAGDV